MIGVGLLEVRHQGGEGRLVGLQRLRIEGAQNILRPALVVLGPGVARVIALDERRHVGRHRILPGAEPQQHDVHVVLARLLEDGVSDGEIEMALLRLDLVPFDGQDHGIEADTLQPGPQLRQIVRAGGRRIRQFTAQDQIGLAIDHQLFRRTVRRQMRDWVAAVGIRRKRRPADQCQQGRAQNDGLDLNAHPSSS